MPNLILPLRHDISYFIPIIITAQAEITLISDRVVRAASVRINYTQRLNRHKKVIIHISLITLTAVHMSIPQYHSIFHDIVPCRIVRTLRSTNYAVASLFFIKLLSIL